MGEKEQARTMRGGLFKNPGGSRWQYHFKWKKRQYHGDTGCESYSAAVEWLRAYRQRLSNKAVGIKSIEDTPTLEAALDGYETAQKGVVTDKYLSQKRDRIENHFSKELKRRLSEFDQEILEGARQRYLVGEWAGNGYTKKRKGRSVGGWNSLLRDLKAVFGWAVKRGLLDRVPFTMATTKTQESVKPVIWPEQAKAFLAAVDTWETQNVKTAIRAMLYLGLREDEALGMRWEWLSARAHTYRTGDAKNRKARIIPVPAVLMAYIEKHHKRQAVGLVLSAADGAPHREGLTTECVRRAALAVHVAGMTPHRVRATFASSHHELGTPIGQIQAMLGHENQATTMGYIITRPKDLGEAQDRFAELLEGKAAKSGSRGVRVTKTKKAKKPANTRSK